MSREDSRAARISRVAFIVTGVFAALALSGFIIGIWTEESRWSATGAAFVVAAIVAFFTGAATDMEADFA